MAFGNDITENIAPVEASYTPSSTPAVQNQNTAPSTIPVNVNLDEILKKLGITFEAFQKMSPAQQNELIQSYKQLTSNPDELPSGWTVEKTTTNEVIQVPETPDTLVVAKENVPVQTPEVQNSQDNKPAAKKISNEEWKQMTPEERLNYIKNAFKERHQDLSGKELENKFNEINEKILKDKFPNWETLSEREKELINFQRENTFKMLIDSGMTYEEYSKLSFLEKDKLGMEYLTSQLEAADSAISRGGLTNEESDRNLKIIQNTDAAIDYRIEENIKYIRANRADVSLLAEYESKYGKINFASTDQNQAYMQYKAKRMSNMIPADQFKYCAAEIDDFGIRINELRKTKPKLAEKMQKDMDGLYASILPPSKDLKNMTDEEVIQRTNIIESYFADRMSKEKPGTKNYVHAAKIRTQSNNILINRGMGPHQTYVRDYRSKKHHEALDNAYNDIKPTKHNTKFRTNQISKLEDDGQRVKLAQSVLKSTEQLDDETSVEIQKMVADEVAQCDNKEVQDAIYEMLSQSEFSEVRQYAERSYNEIVSNRTGGGNNGGAVASTRENTSVSYQTNPIVSNPSYENVNMSSPAAKSVYDQLMSGQVSIGQVSDSFNRLTQSEKQEILKSLPKSELVKMPVSICGFCPEFIPQFVAAHRGIEIIKTVPDAASQTIRCMKKSNDNKVKKQLNEFMIENPAMFMKISVEAAKKSLGIEDNPPTKPLQLRG